MQIFTNEGQTTLVNEKRGRKKYPVLFIGIGPDSFIGPTAWVPNILATFCFIFKWAAPSRDEQKTKQVCADYGLDPDHCSNDYQTLVMGAVEEEKEDLVVAITTETQHHFEQIKFCIKAGVKTILLDKPPVDSMAQWREIRDLAEEHGVVILVSYQHTLNPVVEQMAVIAAAHIEAHGPESVEVHGFFLQDWLYRPPMEIRQVWRLEDQWCGLKDIGTHAGDMAAVVAGAPIDVVTKSIHGKARVAELEKPAFDNGEMDVTFTNGVTGSVRYHQALPGHTDDIGVVLSLTTDEGNVHFMFRMEWSSDGMFISTGNGDIEDLEQWGEPLLRGADNVNDSDLAAILGVDSDAQIFDEEVLGLFGKNPGGHIQGWDVFWMIFFWRCYRVILESQGREEAAWLKPLLKGRCPDFVKSGGHTTAVVDASIDCHESGETASVSELLAG
jgi:predicted dehydrogenase